MPDFYWIPVFHSLGKWGRLECLLKWNGRVNWWFNTPFDCNLKKCWNKGLFLKQNFTHQWLWEGLYWGWYISCLVSELCPCPAKWVRSILGKSFQFLDELGREKSACQFILIFISLFLLITYFFCNNHELNDIATGIPNSYSGKTDNLLPSLESWPSAPHDKIITHLSWIALDIFGGQLKWLPWALFSPFLWQANIA